MAIMTVYHGGYQAVEKPEIRKGRNTKDFGTGFYCTIIKEQAQRWARRYDTKVVSVYDVRLKSNLKIKDYLKEHTLEELADWFKNHHLKPWAYNTLIFFNQRDEAGEKEIDEEVDFILKVSKAIGMKMLITVPSFDVKDKSVSEIKEEAVARLRYLSDKVGADMKISLEFCGAPNCSINQFGTAYDVVKAVDRDNVGVTVDTFHFHEMCSRLEDLRAADGKKIFAYHLNDCEDLPLGSCGDDKRLWPGEGVVDHAGIAAALKEIGFDGVCTIEEFRPEYSAMSHEDNVKKAAEVTRDFVQKYFG